MTAALQCSRPDPTWDDVRDSIRKLIFLSRRMPDLRENKAEFDLEVNCLSCMLETLTAKVTDKASRSALRSSATSFIRLADEFLKFLEFAITADTAGDLSRDDELVATEGGRWEQLRQNLFDLSDCVLMYCE